MFNVDTAVVHQSSYISSDYAVSAFQNWGGIATGTPPRLTISVSPQQGYSEMASEPVSSTLRMESGRRITELRSLQDGWDGYGGYSPSHMVCDHAMRVINIIASKFTSLPSPDISPSSNGTILFTWELEDREAVIELGDAKYSGYIRCAGEYVPLSGDPAAIDRNEMSMISGCVFLNESY